MIAPFTPREVEQASELRSVLSILGYRLVAHREEADDIQVFEAVAERDEHGMSVQLRLPDRNFIVCRFSWIALAWSAINSNTRDVLLDVITGCISRFYTRRTNGGGTTPSGGAAA